MFLQVNANTVINLAQAKKVEKVVFPGTVYKLRVTQGDGIVVDYDDNTGALFAAFLTKIA